MGACNGLHEITTSYIMFELRNTFPLKGVVSDMFFHYNICANQLHPNI